MKKVIVRNYRSPIGELITGNFDGQLCLCDWRYGKMRDQIDARIKSGLEATFEKGSSKIIEQTIEQLDVYFDATRTNFTIPVLLVGRDF